MFILAQGTLVIFFVFLLFLGGLSLLGLLSFILSYTKARRHWGTLACALPAFILGFVLTVTHGIPKPGDILFAYIASWANLLFGLLGIFRWFDNRAK